MNGSKSLLDDNSIKDCLLKLIILINSKLLINFDYFWK
jgi:hypothetical protein